MILGLVGLGGWMIAQGLRGGSTRSAASGALNGQGQGAAGAVRDVPPQVQGGAGVFTQDMPEVSSSAGEGLCVDCDVLLLTVCSLRRDHVGAYGALDIRTPHLDRVAAEGMRFDTAYSASNFTLASLTAVLTGRFGSSTGVTGWDKGLTTDVPTLPEVLGHYGYQTGGFTTDAPSGFRPDYGLDRGFQRMEITPPPAGTPDGRGVGIGKAQPGQVVAPAARWLSNQSKDKPVFMMVHSRTAHFPFVVDKTGFDEDETGVTKLLFEAGKVDTLAREDNQAMPGMAGGTEQEGIVKINGPDPLQVRVNALGEPAVAMWKLRYLEAVQRMDHDMGALWTALEARDRLDKTVIVVVADHGESLNDYGELLHGDAFHDGVIHVPLMIRVPGLRGGQSTDALVSQVDILPTILDLVGAVDPSGIDGQSMVPLLTQAQAQIRSALLSEGGVALQEGPEMPGAVIAPPWVMLRQRRGCGPGSIRLGGELPLCLFNTVDDPPQVKNIAQANPETVELLLERWNGFREARANSGQQLDLSPAFVEELQRTGYDFRTGAPE